MSYTTGNYKISLVVDPLNIGQQYLQIRDIVNDTYPEPAEIADILQFRVIIMPLEQWSAGPDFTDYNAVCAYYNIEP